MRPAFAALCCALALASAGALPARADDATDQMQEALKVEGATTHPCTPEEFGNLIRADLERWKEVVANAHIEETE